MQMLYLDESIDSELVVLGGVYLPDSKYRKFNSDFEIFLKNLNNYPYPSEVHAEHIWNGRSDFSHLTDLDQRAKLSEKIAEFIGQSTLTRFYLGVSYIDGGSNDDIYLQLLDKIIDKSVKRASSAGTTTRQLLLVFDQRQDINSDIHEMLIEKRADIVRKYSSSCAFIDAGYEGVSRYSRLIQVADLVAYWGRQFPTSKMNPSLLKTPNDIRKTKLISRIEKYWERKLEKI